MRVRYSAPCKVILSGEHFVVHGSRAIATAVAMRAYVDAERLSNGSIKVISHDLGRRLEYSEGKPKGDEVALNTLLPIVKVAERVKHESGSREGVKLEISCQAPSGSGLGSSAAVSVATAAATARVYGLNLSLERLREVASVAEEMLHFKPSGIDTAISTYGGTIVYAKDKPYEKVEAKVPKRIIVCYTGKPRKTADMVKKVSDLSSTYPSIFKHLLEAADNLVSEVRSCMERGDAEGLATMLNMNDSILAAVGVSSDDTERAVRLLRRAGCIGAKVTGGGGGGSVIGLTRDGYEEHALRLIKLEYPSSYLVSIDEPGVKAEKI